MVTSLASQAPVRQQISISKQATVVETGSTIDVPNEIYDELKWQVQSEFQPMFEEAVANAENVELIIPGLKIHMYRIHWIQRVYQSTISFSMNDQACTALCVHFRYPGPGRLHYVGLYSLKALDLVCQLAADNNLESMIAFLIRSSRMTGLIFARYVTQSRWKFQKSFMNLKWRKHDTNIP